MPELPDVEAFSRYLKATALHNKISAVDVSARRLLSDMSVPRLKRTLQGRCFESARRHGKNLFILLDSGNWLHLHFGMTGYLRYFKSGNKGSKYDRVTFRFANGYCLAYESRRMLGKVGLTDDPDSFISDKGLGPDALHLSFGSFDEILDDRRVMIKSILMDQKMIAGIGNVYSDEILFHARIHPRSKVEALSARQRKEVFRSMGRVLATAVRCGADPDRFPRSFMLPRRREGEKCPYCGDRIRKDKIGGRSSYFCPACQPQCN